MPESNAKPTYIIVRPMSRSNWLCEVCYKLPSEIELQFGHKISRICMSCGDEVVNGIQQIKEN